MLWRGPSTTGVLHLQGDVPTIPFVSGMLTAETTNSTLLVTTIGRMRLPGPQMASTSLLQAMIILFTRGKQAEGSSHKNSDEISRTMLTEEQQICQKRKKDSFSVKSHP